jgi:hypothetical protein
MENIKKLIKNKIENKISNNEGYKWKPSAAQRKAFAEKMKNPIERHEYEKKKELNAEKRRSTSKFDYSSAGGNYIPTKAQYDFAMKNMEIFKSEDEKFAANQVIYGYTTNEKIHHDNIHIVNEKMRSSMIS